MLCYYYAKPAFAVTFLCLNDYEMTYPAANLYLSFIVEIDISVLLTISPSMTIIEADNFSVSCMVNSPNKSESVLLIKGSNILSTGKGKTDYGQTAGTGHSGEYMCKVEINGVFKIDKKMLTVKGETSEEELGFRLSLRCLEV